MTWFPVLVHTGPWRVTRVVISTGFCPFTGISSRSTRACCTWLLNRYCPVCTLIRSMYRSCTSKPRFVTPHEMRSLCPDTTLGAPGMEAPATFIPGA